MPASYHAARQIEPKQFERIVTKKDQGGTGIDFLIGFKRGGGSEVQSIHFDKSKFTAAQARAWLKKHKFSASKFEPAMKNASEAMEYPFEKIYSMLESALREKYPGKDGYGCQFYIRTMWTDKALLMKGYYAEEEVPNLCLITFSVVAGDKQSSPYVEIAGDPIPVQIQAVPKDGGDAVVLDEGEHQDFDEAGKRNASGDSKTMNTVMRMLMDLMDDDDFEEETMMKWREKDGGKSKKPMKMEGKESDVDEAKWDTAYINTLPDSSFAYVEPGEKDDSGKTTPRSKRHLPYKNDQGVPDKAHIRNALARLDSTDISAAAKASARKKLVAAAKKAGIGDYDNEAIEPDEDIVVEGWSSLSGETITETFSTSLEESHFDEKNLVIKNVKMLGNSSVNGRDYPEVTQKEAIPLFEGTKAYLNHAKKKDAEEPRQVQEQIGYYKNVSVKNGGMYGDLHLVDKPIVREEVLPYADKKVAHLVGNSIVARAQMSKQKNGRMLVEKILAARSVDLVAEPATTISLYEGKTITESQESVEENAMEYKDITLDALKKERPELIEALLVLNKENEQAKITALQGEVTARDAKLAAKDEELKAKDASLKEAEKKLLERETAEAKRQKDDLVKTVMTEAKLPDSVKYETNAEGKKVFKTLFRNVIERCANEEEMRALVADIEKTYGNATPISEEKRLDFSTTTTIPANGSLHNAAYDAFVN